VCDGGGVDGLDGLVHWFFFFWFLYLIYGGKQTDWLLLTGLTEAGQTTAARGPH
jgi:hypothetical protein